MKLRKKEEREREGEYVDIELADEAGEVVVLEIVGEKGDGELGNVGDEEAVTTGEGPGDDGVGGRVFHHVVTLVQERRHRDRTILTRFHHHHSI